MLNTAKTTVTPENTTATVTFSGQIPELFLVSAYLPDGYDYSPPCPSYETPMYTQDMQELLALPCLCQCEGQGYGIRNRRTVYYIDANSPGVKKTVGVTNKSGLAVNGTFL